MVPDSPAYNKCVFNIRKYSLGVFTSKVYVYVMECQSYTLKFDDERTMILVQPFIRPNNKPYVPPA